MLTYTAVQSCRCWLIHPDNIFLIGLQSPWGVASGAIVGHLVATSIAILGGAILANYISEKLVSLTEIRFCRFILSPSLTQDMHSVEC